MLKAQDLLVTLKLAARRGERWTLEALGTELEMSPSGVHASIGRAATCGLLDARAREPIRPALLELLVHGVRYVFPAERGRRRRGVLTGPSAPPLSAHLASTEVQPLVWPYARGEARGESVSPLSATAPQAALRDPALYELLVLVDGIRLGGARVREVASRELKARLTR